MRIEENEGGGESVILEPGDDLAAIPDSHSHLLPPELREAFDDPVERLREVADRCPFPEMKRWLEALLVEPRWRLELHQGYPAEFNDACFWWSADGVRSASVNFSQGRTVTAPQSLVDYYALVDRVDWMGFGCAGNLEGPTGITPLQMFLTETKGDEIDFANGYVWGWSPCGDMMIWTADDQAGWVSHENGQIQILGTIEEFINWVYRELNENRCPDLE